MPRPRPSVRVCVATFLLGGGVNTFDTSATENVYVERENSALDEMSAAVLADYMMQSKPVNVEKYDPIYWEGKAATKGMSGSMATMPPLRFAQKNNQNHYIYGIGYLRYKTPTGKTETLYTDVLPAAVNIVKSASKSVSKSGQQAATARQMARRAAEEQQ